MRTQSQAASRRVTPTPTTATTDCHPDHVEKLLPNGDLFTGTFAGNSPHGTGKYLWKGGYL